uniref:Putative ovule protein n=1 Tax=Solanum chacoense TaxID=4108 RepID=A0A0V0HB58_SOLCH
MHFKLPFILHFLVQGVASEDVVSYSHTFRRSSDTLLISHSLRFLVMLICHPFSSLLSAVMASFSIPSMQIWNLFFESAVRSIHSSWHGLILLSVAPLGLTIQMIPSHLYKLEPYRCTKRK